MNSHCCCSCVFDGFISNSCSCLCLLCCCCLMRFCGEAGRGDPRRGVTRAVPAGCSAEVFLCLRWDTTTVFQTIFWHLMPHSALQSGNTVLCVVAVRGASEGRLSAQTNEAVSRGLFLLDALQKCFCTLLWTQTLQFKASLDI